MPTVRTITAGGPAPARETLGELWSQREVIAAFALRSLRVRYRQAVLGMAWTIAQPLALLIPYVLFFRRADSGPVAGTLAALIGWQYLSSAVSNGSSALVSEAFLVRKAWFPREAPVVAAVGAALVELFLGLALYAVAGPILGAQAGWGNLAGAIVGAISLVAVATALALPLAALNAQYRDVRHALPFLMLLWLFVSPVFFPLTGSRRWLIAILNPAAGPLETLRRGLAEGALPQPELALSLTSALVLGLVGYRYFRQIAPILPDVV